MKLELKEVAQEMTVQEFINDVKKIYANHFPESHCKVGLVKILGRAIFMDFYLAEDQTELINGYWENDMFKCSCVIHLPDNAELTSLMPETVTLQSMSSYIRTKPPVKYLAYGSVKVPFRKTTGNSKKILDYLDKYISRIAVTLYNVCTEDLVAESDEEVAKKVEFVRK